MPPAAQPLINRVARLMSRVKITDILTDVDAWTDFTRHFVHLEARATGTGPHAAALRAPRRRHQPGRGQDGRGEPRRDLPAALPASGVARARRDLHRRPRRARQRSARQPVREALGGWHELVLRRTPGPGRGEERARPGGVLHPARGDPGPELRAAALPGQRAQPRDGGDRAVEHGVPGARDGPPSRARRGTRRGAPGVPVTARVGAHQPDGRLRVVASRLAVSIVSRVIAPRVRTHRVDTPTRAARHVHHVRSGDGRSIPGRSVLPPRSRPDPSRCRSRQASTR